MQLRPDDPRLLGVRLRRELVGAGYTDRFLAAAVRSGQLVKPRRGAYVDGEAWRGLTADQRYAVRCRAVQLQAQTAVVLSHVSSLPFLGAPLWGLDLSEVHLTRRDGRVGRREADVRQHRGALAASDVIEINGIAVSSPARVALEVSMVASVEASLAVANHLLNRGLIEIADLRARYDGQMDMWPYTLGTDLMLRLADPRIESLGESRTLYAFYRQGLPKPVPQYEVYDDRMLVARLDFALPDHGVWIEFDGRVKYEVHLRDGESATDVVLREKRREERIAELTGWRCVRVTWDDLTRPELLAARVRSAIESVAKARRIGA